MLPEITKKIETLMEIATEKVLIEVAIELNELAQKSLKEQGYLD